MVSNEAINEKANRARKSVSNKIRISFSRAFKDGSREKKLACALWA